MWLMEKAMAPHSNTLAWRIPWTEEPGGLQSMGSLGVRHDWATSLSHFTFVHWRRKWQPTPVFLPGESQGWRSLVGCLSEVAQSRTRLKRLSSSGSNVTNVNNFLNFIIVIFFIPWTARRSNQSILKEISLEYSLEGLILKLKLEHLATWWKELTHWKRPWCWRRL